MIKRIIFIVILVLVVAASVYIGLRPFGIFAAWQGQIITQEQIEEAEAQKREEEQRREEEEQRRIAEEEQRKEAEENKPPKGIQISLDAKADQILQLWTFHGTVNGAVNVLQEINTSAAYPGISPLAGLAPYEKALTRISKLYEAALGILSFEKTLLMFYIVLALFIFIPVCIIISIFKLFKQRDMNALPGMAVSSVLICLAVLFALPASLKLATLADDMVFSGNIDKLVSSINQNVESAKNMEVTLRGVSRLGAPVLDHIENAKKFSGEAVRSAIYFFIYFLFTYIIIPALVIFGFYKLTSFCVKLILKTG